MGDSKTRENCITDLFKGLFEVVAYAAEGESEGEGETEGEGKGRG